MSSPDDLRAIRDKLRTGMFGQREVWEQQLASAADEIERLRAVADISAEALRHMNAVIADEGGFRKPNGMIARKMAGDALDAYLALFNPEQRLDEK